MKFSNPRMTAEFNDWPIGGDHRGQCKFTVETDKKRGQRVARQTTDKNGRWCKPKYTTYANQARIVDGDNGRVYLLMWSTAYGSAVTIKSHDMQHDQSFPDLPHYVTPDHERYKEIIELVTATLQPS